MIVAKTGGVYISFDPLEVENNIGSVKFKLQIKFDTINQNSNVTFKAIWIEETELNKFENQLKTEGISQLTDMSGFTILRLQHVDNFTKIEINPINARMSNEYERLNISMFVEGNLITHLYRAFNDYAKWW